MSSDNLHELVDFSARQIVDNVEKEMKLKPSGIDPRRTFMNATLNVGTTFMLNDRLDFDDPEQVMVMNWVEVNSLKYIIQNSIIEIRIFSTISTCCKYRQCGPVFFPCG